MTPAKITIVQGTPEWEMFCEAMNQYHENLRDYIETDLEPGEDPKAEARFKVCESVVEKIDAAIARLAE